MKNDKDKKSFIQKLIIKLENSTLFKPVKLLWELFLKKMKKSIRFELVVVFGVCLLIGILSFGINNFLSYNRNGFTSYIFAFAGFIISFLIITNNTMKYIQEISKGLKEISEGKLSYRIPIKGEDELSNLANNINYMAQEIETKMQSERKAEKTKNELVTNVSHDLRTPLTSVIGYIGLAKDHRYNSPEELQEYLNIAYTKSERLKLLIDDLFEYTKLTNDGVSLTFQRINIIEFLEQLIEEVRTDFEENELILEDNLPEEKVYINADANKLLRVFENLFSNSIKYSYKPGTVSISLEAFSEVMIFSINNKGDRIERENIKKIFDRFYRGDEARSSTVSGSGLGLAITKNIVELHGGRVWANCDHNDLITFYVQLPLFK